MLHAEDVIIKPIITEKSYQQMASGKYTFQTKIDATKIDIKVAIEKLFNVKVLKVNTMRYDGKKKRVGVHEGKTASWKKAIVQIDKNPKDGKYLTKGGKAVTKSKKYNTEIAEINSAFASVEGGK